MSRYMRISQSHFKFSSLSTTLQVRASYGMLVIDQTRTSRVRGASEIHTSGVGNMFEIKETPR